VDWITDQVAIGNYLEAQDVAFLKCHGFRSALSLDGTLVERQAAELGLAKVVSYTLIDGPGNDPRVLRFAVDDLTDHCAKKVKLFRVRSGDGSIPHHTARVS
jgi:hypothetical protein